MTSRDFCYWLQGLFEVGNPKTLDAEQVACIKRHLALVFKHEIDPAAGNAEHQATLNEIHNAPPATGRLPPTIGGVTPDGLVFRC